MRRCLAILVTLTLVFVVGRFSNGAPINETFDDGSGVNVLGSANVNAGSLQLTPNAGSQFGSAVLNGPVTTVAANNKLHLNLAVVLDPGASLGEADGVSFFIFSNTQPPLNGSGQLPASSIIGNAEDGNVAGAFSVAFDIHPDPFGAGSNPGISLSFNGAEVAGDTNPSFDFSSADFHDAFLEIEFLEDGSADVSLYVTEDIFGTPGATEALFNDVNIAGFGPGDYRFGFAARTGGQAADQRIDNFSAVLVPEPGSLLVWFAVAAMGLCGWFCRKRIRS